MKSTTPLWETMILVGSFVLLWAWFLAFKGAERAHQSLPLWWHFFLLIAVVLLFFVMRRRVQRLQRAMRGQDEEGNSINMNNGPTGYPTFTSPPPDRRDKS